MQHGNIVLFLLGVLVLLLAKNTLYCTLIRQNHTLGKGNILQNTRNFPVLTTHFQSNICQVRPSNLMELNIFRGGSRGRVQEVRTTPPPEMTCGFLIQLVFCKKKTMWFIGVEVEQETSALPPKKKSWIRP